LARLLWPHSLIPLHLVSGEPLLRAVVKLGRTRALVRRHFLRVLERAAVSEVGGNPGGAEGVAADSAAMPAAGRAGGSCARRRAGSLACQIANCLMPACCAKEPALAVLGDAGGVDIGT
jgi:hypothetical protein